MIRIVPVAAAAVILSASMAFGASHSPRQTADTPVKAQSTAANQFGSEVDAKSHCRGDSVVWVNTKTRVYHLAGTADYGRTKHGAFMCQADADHSGKFRAAKNEKAMTGSSTR